MIARSLVCSNVLLDTRATLKEASCAVQKHPHGVVVFVDEAGHLIGILTERDVVRLLAENHDFSAPALVYATKHIVSMREDCDLEDVATFMMEKNVRRVVICDEKGRFLGIVTQDVIFHELGEEVYKTKLRAKHLLNNKSLISITCKDTLGDALKVMAEHRIGTLPMLNEQGKLMGILTEHKVLEVAKNASLLELPAKEFINRNPASVYEEAPVNEIIDFFEHGSSSVLVLDAKRILVGIVTKRDLLRSAENGYKNAIEESFRATHYALNNFPQSVIECYYLTTTMVVQWANNRALECLGAEIIDKPLSHIIGGTTYDHIAACISEGLRVEPFNIEVGGKYYEVTLAKTTQHVIQLVFTDVTRHKEYEEELKRDQRIVNDILDFQSSLVLVTNGKEITNINKACLDFFGLKDLHEFRKKYGCIRKAFVPQSEVSHEEHNWIYSMVNRSRDGGDTKAIMRNAQGEERIFTIKARTYPEDDTKFIVSFADVTELEMSKHELEHKVVLRTQELSRVMSLLEEAQKIARLGYWQYSIKDEMFLYSKEIGTMIGLEGDGEMKVEEVLRFTYPEDRNKLARSFFKATKYGRDSSRNIRCIDVKGAIISTYVHMKAPSAEQKDMLFGICQDIGEQIELKKIAYYDPLTQIYNRNKFYELVTHELELVHLYKQSLAIIIFDIDFFKKINDTHGHGVGDEVLVELTQVVSGEIRSTDIFARWGGEEFVIVAPQTTLEGAYRLAEKVRGVIADSTFSSKELKVTCSFGVTSIRRFESIESALERTDGLLYEAKRNGRNQVIKEKDGGGGGVLSN
ncbi:MAG: diguanylate cyclase [Wolinella sp.]